MWRPTITLSARGASARWSPLASSRCCAARVDYTRSGKEVGFTVKNPNFEGEALKKWLPVLEAQGITPDRLFSTPTPFNAVLWRVLVLDGEQYHEALVGWFDRQPPHLNTTLGRATLPGRATRAKCWFT